MLSLLYHINGLRFRNVYLYSRSLQQPKYQMLKKVIEQVPEMKVEFCDAHEDVVPPEQMPPNTVVIFDDVACEKQQDPMRAFFSMGRHSNVDSFYLGQSYARIPKQLVRDNANVVMLFNQDLPNLRHVYDEQVAPDMTWAEFQKLCRDCWKKDKYGYVVIDRDSPVDGGRYRCGLDQDIRQQQHERHCGEDKKGNRRTE